LRTLRLLCIPSLPPRWWLAPLALLLLLLPYPAPLHAQGDEWWEPAARDTQDQLNTLKSTLDETVKKIDEAKEELARVEAWVTNNLGGRERDALLNQLRGAKDALDTHSQPLRMANNRLGRVTSVIDGALELKDLADAARQRQGGNLAAAMHIVGVAMANYGQDVPLIGDMVGFYGEAIGQILDATDQIAQSVEENRNQGMFGAGTHLGIQNPLYQALAGQFGQDFADAHIFEPANYPYLYQSIDNDQRNFTLIWDSATQTWTRINRSPADVAQLYRSYVLARGHPTPQILGTLAGVSFEPSMLRIEAGQDAAALWNALNSVYGNVAFDTVNRAGDYELLVALQDVELFAARYAHDQAFNRQVQAWMVAMYQAARQAQADGLDDGSTAAAIRAWAEKYGVALPDDEAEEAEEGEAEGESAAGEAEAGEAETSRPGSVTSSVVILFDASGSMADFGRIDTAKRAARNVLSQVTPETEVALIVFYTCGDIRVEHPFTTDAASVLAQVEAITPSGSTPLAAAITFAREYINANARGAARLVVLSDGMETCGGDPVAAARQ
jgi:hypothetical protein